MLIGIPETFTPQLLKLMMEIGHGERLLICDGNFPYKSRSKETVFIPNVGIGELLDQVLAFFPLDHAVDQPATVMDGALKNHVAQDYMAIISKHKEGAEIQAVGRFDFYDEADTVAGIIVTNDRTMFGNIIIQKGVVK